MWNLHITLSPLTSVIYWNHFNIDIYMSLAPQHKEHMQFTLQYVSTVNQWFFREWRTWGKTSMHHIGQISHNNNFTLFNDSDLTGYVTMYKCMWLPKFQMDVRPPSAVLETRVQYNGTMQNTAIQILTNVVTSNCNQFLVFGLINLISLGNTRD